MISEPLKSESSAFPDPAESFWANTFRRLLSRNEGWLMGRVLSYAKDRAYTKYTSTLLEAWRLSIQGVSASLMAAVEGRGTDLELGPEEDYTSDPAASFGILEAKRHRERGVSLEMFLGLMKYYRQSYKDLVAESIPDRPSLERALLMVERFFDRMEIGFCSEWATSTENELLAELQGKNRLMTNEKNKYLTAFESLPEPVFILDADNRIQNMNHAASLLFEESRNPGAEYYRILEEDLGLGRGTTPKRPVHLLLPWLVEDLAGFQKGETDRHWVERTAETMQGKRVFQARFSRMLDVSGKFEGTILILQDVTAQKNVEQERLKKEKLEAVLEMAGAVCHELNQPLQGLSGHAELLALDMDRESPHYSRVSKITELVHAIGKITKQLSGITRYETTRYLDGRIVDLRKASEPGGTSGSS